MFVSLGAMDMVSSGRDVYVLSSEGSLKRCGGQVRADLTIVYGRETFISDVVNVIIVIVDEVAVMILMIVVIIRKRGTGEEDRETARG